MDVSARGRGLDLAERDADNGAMFFLPGRRFDDHDSDRPRMPTGLAPYESSKYGNAIGVCWEGTSHNDVVRIMNGHGLDAAAVRRTIEGARRRRYPRRCQCENCWPPGTMPDGLWREEAT